MSNYSYQKQSLQQNHGWGMINQLYIGPTCKLMNFKKWTFVGCIGCIVVLRPR